MTVGPGGDNATFVEFCGERFPVVPSQPFYIGREATLTVDDNPYLHRRFLLLHDENGMWWLTNLGTHLTATVTAADLGFTATLGPGARMPLVFGRTSIVFSAGPTTYEVQVQAGAPAVIPPPATSPGSGDTTRGVPNFTESQKLAVLVLAEAILRRDGTGASALPSSAQAAARLGWSLTKFNRKLDNVCDKLDLIGVAGMRAGGGRLASNRRLRLVEYALSTGLVAREDLPMLDAEHARNLTGR
ncbi:MULTISPECIES: hypothetical protein [Gordonia]|jgi:hypothetical protein|uniref:FHA domain-containing protein n=1 Tax=Gordonia malaquae NBRC 108250 TaxID=1223542 RepID=M3VB30_GORML|nr:hypothetical protein [Gordonia malaquae]GAC79548.1 hypothetical protein GM1_010_01380 [Gordonia malaquae NBRC 108250]SEC60955.1 hypothetical protein SAMN04488550_2096 [Gordonia malaquae]